MASSDSDGDDRARSAQLETSVFASYLEVVEKLRDRDGDVAFGAGIDKVRNYIVNAQSRTDVCLICLEKVRPTDPAWQCSRSCFTSFHLICIQAWARQSAASAALRSVSNLTPELFPNAAADAHKSAQWHCPKCRCDYAVAEAPTEYRCFCGKERDPEYDPWLLPHTCGEMCGKPLATDGSAACEHTCTLLCHPGPCPPCPQLTRVSCHCGARKETKRCGQGEGWSCGHPCKKRLACGAHACPLPCHTGSCPPCSQSSERSCLCGAVRQKRACEQVAFRCDKSCDKPLPCGKHRCQKGCHEGPCGGCPLSGSRRCPCGKMAHDDLSCDEVVPTCGRTCDKLLSCGIHRCPQACHTGGCTEVCLSMIEKQCRCGALTRSVPCHETVKCQSKCTRPRNCERHQCKRRCCDGDCPPCPEVCGRKLRCGNHKCPAPCHRGPCLPCPVTVRIACACGATAVTVPCGADSGVRPPRCFKFCPVPPTCHHGSGCVPHLCHFGPCPLCELPCGRPHECQHACPDRCHDGPPGCGPAPPSNCKSAHKAATSAPGPSGPTSALPGGGERRPCPPCQVPVRRRCVGGHEERPVPCTSAPFHCDAPCGQPLACGNHRCALPCHAVDQGEPQWEGMSGEGVPGTPSEGRATKGGTGQGVTGGSKSKGPTTTADCRDGSADSASELRMACRPCMSACQKPREPPCPHPCPRPCHQGRCDPCSAVVRLPCHCNSGEAAEGRGSLLSVECSVLARAQASADAYERLLSCGDVCRKKLPFCTHTCTAMCHGGPCPQPTQCKRKVTIRCPCRRLKKEVVCSQLQAAAGPSTLLPCDEQCAKEQEAAAAAREQPPGEEEAKLYGGGQGDKKALAPVANGKDGAGQEVGLCGLDGPGSCQHLPAAGL
eukprot:jgi/Mesvir1/26241/Mv05719-RA.2